MPKKPPHNELFDKLVKEKLDTFYAARTDYTEYDTQSLLLIEALNDWSQGKWAEGGSIMLTEGGDHPCCATGHELSAIAKEGFHKYIFFPVSGFCLEDDQLFFTYHLASYCLTLPEKGSPNDIVRYAENEPIRDVESAMHLWLLCAVEDCIANLEWHLQDHQLYLGNETKGTIREVFRAALNKSFSVGQVWNAIWRTSRAVAALSTKTYFNGEKAVRTLPKKIDKVLTEALATAEPIAHYDRLEKLPPGALSSLFLRRFGITHTTTGNMVREIFKADYARGASKPLEEEYRDHKVSGKFIFKDQFTDLDHLFISSFIDIEIENNEPEWDSGFPGLGVINYTLPDEYHFEGRRFIQVLLETYFLTDFPSVEEIERFRSEAEEKRKSQGIPDQVSSLMVDLAFKEKLDSIGIEGELQDRLIYVNQYQCEPETLTQLLNILPFEHGLVAIRQNHTSELESLFERSTLLACGDHLFPNPPFFIAGGDSDLMMVAAVTAKDEDALGKLVTEYIKGTGPIIPYHYPSAQRKNKAKYLKAIARHLEAAADSMLASTPHNEDSADHAGEFEKTVLSGSDGKDL